jgi:hypothetical protein
LALDAAERQALHTAAPALDRYARSLIAKRWQEVAAVVPLTLRIAPGLESFYCAWVATRPPIAADTILPPGAAEGLRALGPLREKLSSDRQAEYAADLLAFEVLGACSRTDGVERWLSSRWPLGELAAHIRAFLFPVDPEERPVHFRFDRTGVRWRPA